MTDLIARLENASEGSRELSDEVLVALGWIWSHFGGWKRREPSGHLSKIGPNNCTVSLDDALGLVPDLWSIDLAWCTEMGAVARIYFGPIRENSAGEPTGRAATPALALCASILRAKEADHAR